MINRLRVPMNKTDSLQEQMGNTGKEVEILWKNQKEMLRIKNTVKQKLRMFLMNLVDWKQLKKEILGLRIPQQDFSKTEKQTEKNTGKKKWDRISKNCAMTTKGTIQL